MEVVVGIFVILCFMIILFLIMNTVGTFLFKMISGSSEPVRASITTEDVQRFAMMLERFTYFKNLSNEGKKKFLQRTVDFMLSKDFDGRDGLQVTEEMKVLVSASAAQLLFGLPQYRLSSFYNLRIFPTIFYSRLMNVHMKGGTTRGGVIMLSWKDFLAGYANDVDKLNLGLHELAHALRIEVEGGDDYSGTFATYMENWDLISRETFLKVKNDQVPFLRKYAGTNTMEFWAVCVEHFFEAPIEFNEQLPKIYRYMCVMLNQDPANIHYDYSVNKEVIPTAKELIKSTPVAEAETEIENETTERKITLWGDGFLFIAFILIFPLAPEIYQYMKISLVAPSVIFVVFLLNFAITLFLAKKIVIPNDKISIPILFKSLVLGGALGTFVFLYLNDTFSKPLPIETYAIKSVWKDFGSDRGQAVFKDYVVDLEGDAYKDDPIIRTFEFEPDKKFVEFNFGDGLFGIKVLKEKKLRNEKGQNLPSAPKDFIHQVDSLLIKKDTAGIRDLFKEMQGDK